MPSHAIILPLMLIACCSVTSTFARGMNPSLRAGGRILQESDQQVLNVALHKAANQSSTCYGGDANRAVDGDTNPDFAGGSVTHTCGGSQDQEWWMVDLGGDHVIQSVTLYSRNLVEERLSDFFLEVLDADQMGVEEVHHFGPIDDPNTFTFGHRLTGRFVRIHLVKNHGAISLAEVEVMGFPVQPPTTTPKPVVSLPATSPPATTATQSVMKPSSVDNVALNKVATQSSTCYGGDAERAVDGNTDGEFSAKSVTHTCETFEDSTWWMVDLGQDYPIETVEVYNRLESESETRLSNFFVEILDNRREEVKSIEFMDRAGDAQQFAFQGAMGRFVRIRMADNASVLSLAEVQVFPSEFRDAVPPTGSEVTALAQSPPLTNVAFNKVATQSSTCFRGYASRAVDGNVNGDFDAGSVSHTCPQNGGINEWWMVDLGGDYIIDSVTLRNRDSFQERLANFYVQVLDEEMKVVQFLQQEEPVGDEKTFEFHGVKGHFVRVLMADIINELALAEVGVLGYAA